jgi:hypothetical protein
MIAFPPVDEYNFEVIMIVDRMLPLVGDKMGNFQKIVLQVPLHLHQITNNP